MKITTLEHFKIWLDGFLEKQEFPISKDDFTKILNKLHGIEKSNVKKESLEDIINKEIEKRKPSDPFKFPDYPIYPRPLPIHPQQPISPGWPDRKWDVICNTRNLGE